MSDIIIKTGNKIPGKEITKILGVVKGSTVRATMNGSTYSGMKAQSGDMATNRGMIHTKRKAAAMRSAGLNSQTNMWFWPHDLHASVQDLDTTRPTEGSCPSPSTVTFW